MTTAVRTVVDRLRRNPGGTMLVVTLVLATLLYLPTLSRGLVNYDDPWLVGDNWVVQRASMTSLHTIFFDLSSPHRFVLTPEYLPVRDLSVMLDFSIWGTWYPGFHITNLVVYLAGIALWFSALDQFGVDRKITALCILLWAIHPSHAESVAWISERKGLLAVMFAGVCATSFARFRAGRSAGWLVLAVIAAVFAVWSKAPGAFAVAAIAGLELVLPARRASLRRSISGLGAIAIVAGAAFIPVVWLAGNASVIGTSNAHAPAGRLTMVLGVYGFYLRDAAMALTNAVSYPISTSGPSTLEICAGALGLLATAAIAVVPAQVWRRTGWTPSPELRAGAAVWLIGWLPIGHLLIPLQMVLVADRYLLFPSLGLALMAAAGIARIPRPAIRRALIGALVLAASLRTLAAQAAWSDARALWERAVASNPRDANAWSMYVDALSATGEVDRASAAVTEGLALAPSARLVMHEALLELPRDRARGILLMQQAAESGEPRAMTNLALLLSEQRRHAEALTWARRGAGELPGLANGHRIHGKVAFDAHAPAESLAAFERALELEPRNASNRYNMALALIELKKWEEAKAQLRACLDDPEIGGRASKLLARLTRPKVTP